MNRTNFSQQVITILSKREIKLTLKHLKAAKFHAPSDIGAKIDKLIVELEETKCQPQTQK